ncbi:MAG: nuclear transport factor 2 family protein [Thermoplasmata archaeon]|nr:nuclear transport factor 2 family protein [Thermoplasmata archaeon]
MGQLTEQDARLLIANVNTRDVEKVVAQYAEDATFQVPNLDEPVRGKDAIRAFLSGSFAAFPDWRMVVSKVIVSGGETIVVNSVHGTHSGHRKGADGQSIPPTNMKFSQDQLTRVVFNKDGKVQSLRAYGYPTEMSRQVGFWS